MTNSSEFPRVIPKYLDAFGVTSSGQILSFLHCRLFEIFIGKESQ